MIRVVLLVMPLLWQPVHDVTSDDGGSSFVPQPKANRNPLTNELCCGPGECFAVPKDQISMDSTGYWIGNWEHVPFAEALPSIDDKFWRCRNPYTQKRRCFFAPPPST